MEALNTDGKIHCRTLWISDVHLGSIHCKADYLLALLDRVKCERLYLVGDIVDVWAMHRRVFWPEAHNQVLRKLLKLSRKQVEIIYIPGNHDQNFREFCGSEFGNVHLRQEAVHDTADGRRFLVIHGDELDYAVRYSRLNRAIGDIAYDFLMWVNRWVNRGRELMGKPYWSLAKWVKGHIAQAEQAITAYQDAAVLMTRQRGLDGIICGHLHHPVIRQYEDVLYCNDGDWVENCTALVEDFCGSLHLIRGIGSPDSAVPVLFAETATSTP
ncbi:UDP-2,3-diacylglucosamine diphosphatase [Parahaliea aestuarii]|uniref:UDP-2,3-diacylglucosamine diphosphatase n=1 Tax=Parahaliea aestuarii TaxID=1852021 RepID=A0A5C9A154_9GAMM|nr:UDP-2,3-diacylglucosamine diphosphatase [Parahaliea aestuarii]TXS93327.1 UDP-2,3-diacylglucosamine diphosphatase [Parahaliea aestuarii]